MFLLQGMAWQASGEGVALLKDASTARATIVNEFWHSHPGMQETVAQATTMGSIKLLQDVSEQISSFVASKLPRAIAQQTAAERPDDQLKLLPDQMGASPVIGKEIQADILPVLVHEGLQLATEFNGKQLVDATPGRAPPLETADLLLAPQLTANKGTKVAKMPLAISLPSRPAPVNGTTVIRPGARVLIHGLTSATSFNGKAGVALQFDLSEGRWKVVLSDGSYDGGVLLKEANLKALASTAAAPSLALSYQPPPSQIPIGVASDTSGASSLLVQDAPTHDKASSALSLTARDIELRRLPAIIIACRPRLDSWCATNCGEGSNHLVARNLSDYTLWIERWRKSRWKCLPRYLTLTGVAPAVYHERRSKEFCGKLSAKDPSRFLTGEQRQLSSALRECILEHLRTPLDPPQAAPSSSALVDLALDLGTQSGDVQPG